MRERLQSFSELRIFSQNVNRNYGYMDSILSSTDYFILFYFFKSTIYNAGHYRSPRAYVQANPVNYDRKLPGPSTK